MVWYSLLRRHLFLVSSPNFLVKYMAHWVQLVRWESRGEWLNEYIATIKQQYGCDEKKKFTIQVLSWGGTENILINSLVIRNAYVPKNAYLPFQMRDIFRQLTCEQACPVIGYGQWGLILKFLNDKRFMLLKLYNSSGKVRRYSRDSLQEWSFLSFCEHLVAILPEAVDLQPEPKVFDGQLYFCRLSTCDR